VQTGTRDTDRYYQKEVMVGRNRVGFERGVSNKFLMIPGSVYRLWREAVRYFQQVWLNPLSARLCRSLDIIGLPKGEFDEL
jgi:hypothetical protein